MSELQLQESYLGIGAEARAIVSGFEAESAALFLDPDVERIDKAGGSSPSTLHRRMVIARRPYSV